MDLSIIILNYKTKKLVRYALQHLQQTVSGLSYEIIVVDNDSRDGIEQMLSEEFPTVRFIQTGSNIGFAKGNNTGMKEAKGEYIMILNPDIFVLPESVNSMVSYMKQHPEIGMLGPKLLNGDRTIQYSCRTFITPWTVLYRRTILGRTKAGKKHLQKYLMENDSHDQIKEVDWIMGACQLVRAKDLEKVGMYDGRFFLYVEDMEWCRRFWMNGLKVVYYPQASMIHLHEQSSATTLWGFLKWTPTVRMHINSYIKYWLKYFRNKNYGSAPTTRID